MDAKTVYMELKNKGVIPDGIQEEISKTHSRRLCNEILHASLEKACTDEALMKTCSVIIAVEGNPKMCALGADMKKRLKSGVCIYLCVHWWLPLPL